MRWPFPKPPASASRDDALGLYLRFMEGRGPPSFTFPKGDYSSDQIVRDVEGIILHETRDMDGSPWRDRLHEFQRRRGRPWPNPSTSVERRIAALEAAVFSPKDGTTERQTQPREASNPNPSRKEN